MNLLTQSLNNDVIGVVNDYMIDDEKINQTHRDVYEELNAVINNGYQPKPITKKMRNISIPKYKYNIFLRQTKMRIDCLKYVNEMLSIYDTLYIEEIDIFIYDETDLYMGCDNIMIRYIYNKYATE